MELGKYTLTPEQEAGVIHLLELKHAVLGFRPGKGKALMNYETLPTPQGFRKVGDIKEGDELFDHKGNITKVLGVYPQGKKPIWRFHFSDGQIVDSVEEHLWVVLTKDKNHNNKEIIKTSRELLETKRKSRLPIKAICQYPYISTNSLGIKDEDYAYCLGALIGDGCIANNNAIILSSADEEIPNKIAKITGTKAIKSQNNFNWSFELLENERYIGDQSHREIKRLQQFPFLPKELQYTNSYTKKVPSFILYNTEEIRIAFLQGYFDTDGHLHANKQKQSITASSVNKKLAEDVASIFRSLGYECRIQEKDRSSEGKSVSYNIHPLMKKEEVGKFLWKPKKRLKLRENLEEKYQYNSLKLEEIEILQEEEECTCFYVDSPYHTFMCGDYIPTHNTLPAIYAALEQCGDIGKCLVISQKKIIENMWKEDIVPLNILPAKTTFINTELMNINDDVYKNLLRTQWECIIVDECHLLKNPTSVQSKRIHKLCEEVPLVIGLSGTPRCNSDEDLFGIMRALHIGNWGKIKKTEFERDFGVRVLKQFGGHSFYKFEGIKPELKEWWDSKIEKYFLMTDYEAGEMPPLNIVDKVLPFVKTDEYTKALKGIINLPELATTFQKAVAIQKAQQAANGFMYLEDGVVYNIPNFINTKLIDMKKHIDDNPGITRIIVYRFTEDKRKLQEAFGNECTEDLKKFTSGQSKILLMQCQQGVGVNLQVADEIHFYTMDVSFVNYIQMIHRAWRKGRINDVNIFIWQYEGSVEEKIWASVKQKKAIGDLLFSIKSLL